MLEYPADRFRIQGYAGRKKLGIAAVPSQNVNALLFRSAINEDGKQVTSSVEPNLLDCNEPRTFWIRWHSGYIVVGKGDVIDKNKFMDYHSLVARDIRNAAFATHTYPGLWKLNFVEGKYLGNIN